MHAARQSSGPHRCDPKTKQRRKIVKKRREKEEERRGKEGRGEGKGEEGRKGEEKMSFVNAVQGYQSTSQTRSHASHRQANVHRDTQATHSGSRVRYAKCDLCERQ